jgi:hypothetical protein
MSIIVTPLADNKYALVEIFEYREITIPKGYETNGANIPRVFWSIIPPFKPKYLPAVIVHDYLCDKEEYALADRYFEEMLYDIEKSIETKAMVASVKLYHRFKYGVRK